jgi:hypothetical protein
MDSGNFNSYWDLLPMELQEHIMSIANAAEYEVHCKLKQVGTSMTKLFGSARLLPKPNYENILQAVEEIPALFTVRKTINRDKGYSYKLKHVLERYRESLPGAFDRHTYINEYDMSVAMVLAGFKPSIHVSPSRCWPTMDNWSADFNCAYTRIGRRHLHD